MYILFLIVVIRSCYNEEVRNDDSKFINYNIEKYMIDITIDTGMNELLIIEFELERNDINLILFKIIRLLDAFKILLMMEESKENEKMIRRKWFT